MNRHERRATAAKQRPLHLARVAAIHESGHAVARVLVATETGQPVNSAISRIDVGTGQQIGQSVDGNTILYSMATTYGPWLPPIAESFVKSLGLKSSDILAPKQMQEAMRTAEDAGVDIKA